MKPCILVVDDEPLLVETITYNLEKAGYQTLRAADGLSALTLARTAQPDLMVLDLMLPELSGRDVCRALRVDENEHSRNMPILMLSARSSRDEAECCRKAGANDYMTKPFAMRDLIEKVQALLEKSK
ncbi:MAG TPA: response regulator [Abditibacteriaceae bacterium]|jgi:DNA-binding response OmpR family regulator